MTHSHIARRTTDWVKLGMISTDTATFAIVDPCYADVLAKKWDEYINGKLMERTVDSCPNFEEWFLHNRYYPEHEYPAMGETAVLFRTDGDGGWDVEGRFGPYLTEEEADDDGDDMPMVLIELRIRLHDYECDDPDCWKTE